MEMKKVIVSLLFLIILVLFVLLPSSNHKTDIYPAISDSCKIVSYYDGDVFAGEFNIAIYSYFNESKKEFSPPVFFVHGPSEYFFSVNSTLPTSKGYIKDKFIFKSSVFDPKIFPVDGHLKTVCDDLGGIYYTKEYCLGYDVVAKYVDYGKDNLYISDYHMPGMKKIVLKYKRKTN